MAKESRFVKLLIEFLCFILYCQLQICQSLDLNDIFIIVRSQHNTYHANRAVILRKDIQTQQEDLPKDKQATVHLLHETWPDIGSWTYLPLLPMLAKKFPSKAWVLLCEDETRVDVKKLGRLLEKYDHNKHHFLGKALQDSQPVITHHFAFAENPESFSYPDFAAGFIMSMSLIKSLASKWSTYHPGVDFTIDPQHELAMFLWNKGKGVSMSDVPELCAGNETPDCVTSYPVHFPDCGPPIPSEDLIVAVKTCAKFHTDRVPIVLKTWAKDAVDVTFYSDKADPSIPTVSLGIPNTERGHCGKTLAILKSVFNDPVKSKKSWLLIADDDTIISISRLRHLLSCYDPDDTVALGERYGYGVTEGHGYDYITGGGGMVFSRVAVHQLIDSSICSCPSNDSPDDMTLGMCLKRLAIPVTHSPLFHQARPDDYSTKLLAHQKPVSFHKHWMVDPLEVYKQWFSQDAHMLPNDIPMDREEL